MRKPRYTSILHDGESCYLCGRNGCGDPLDWHHVFGGADKKRSEKYGLMVRLCHNRCHIFGKDAIHTNKELREQLQAKAQKRFEEEIGDHDLWMAEFGRNYIFE